MPDYIFTIIAGALMLALLYKSPKKKVDDNTISDRSNRDR